MVGEFLKEYDCSGRAMIRCMHGEYDNMKEMDHVGDQLLYDGGIYFFTEREGPLVHTQKRPPNTELNDQNER